MEVELQELNKDGKAKDEGLDAKKAAKVDPLTEVIGEIGPWQFLWILIPALSVSMHCWMMMSNKWLTYPVDHWCARPTYLRNLSVAEWLNLSSPLLSDGTHDSCHVFNVTYDQVTSRPPEDTEVISCHNWEYDRSLFQDTATERWDLVCDHSYLPRIVQTIFFAGNFVGVLLSGVIADRYGRKFCYLLFLTLWITFGVTSSFVKNFYAWTFLRFLCGAVSLGYNNVLAVYGAETTHGKWRSILGSMVGEFMWNLGHLTLGGLVYGCRNMRTVEMIIGLSNTPFLLLWFVMPESPRWLLAKGHKDRAKRVIGRACIMNRKSISHVESFVDTFNENTHMRHGTFVDLVRTPAMRRNTLIMCLSWLSFSMGYFGLIYNTPSFEWNVFLVFVFPAFLILPIGIADPFLQNLFGRKVMLSMSLIIAGLLLLITMFVPTGSLAVICMAWTGTIFCGLAFGAGYVFTKELYPTMLRTTALSAASASARIGSIISPFIAMLDTVHAVMPLCVYGVIVLICGLLSIFIWPETKSHKLPDTLEECEQMASSKNKWVARLNCFNLCKKEQKKKKGSLEK